MVIELNGQFKHNLTTEFKETMFFFSLRRERHFLSTSLKKKVILKICYIFGVETYSSKIQQKYNLHFKPSLTSTLFSMFPLYFIYVSITAFSHWMAITLFLLSSVSWNSYTQILVQCLAQNTYSSYSFQ